MRALVLALGALVTFSCSGGSAVAVTPTPSLVATAYRLYTHCGILYLDLNGTRYYADPPVSDGNGNPGPGWGNPFDRVGRRGERGGGDAGPRRRRFGFRARQISSDGHCRAHSADTYW